MTDRPAMIAFGSGEVGVAARWLARGGLLIFPTETYYAIGVDPRLGAAVGALRRLKGRPAAQALPLIAGSLSQVDDVVPGWRADPRAGRLADRFWPGPLTLVLPRAQGLAPGVAAADGSVAIRWSSHQLAAALATRLGYPVVSTSANRAGQAPAETAETAELAIGTLAGDSDVLGVALLDGGTCRGGQPSTIVDLTAGGLTISRRGAVCSELIRAALAPQTD